MDSNRKLDRLRKDRSELENHLIDELAAGHISRREFLRRGSVLGLSLPLLASIGTAYGANTNAGTGSAKLPANARTGGTVRAGVVTPTGAVDPLTVDDAGGVCMLAVTGEFLAIDTPDLTLRPVLAESWKPNHDATVWTYKLRKGVKFQDGRPLRADDVVWSINRLANPKNASNALSAFKGVLGADGARKIDDYTVAFHLEAPNGNFPYLLSSDNYNAIIIPADYQDDWEKTFLGTGPLKLEKYTPKVGASFVPNPHYWGSKALPDRVEFTFYEGQQPQVLALEGKQLDVMQQISVQGGEAILSNPGFRMIDLKSSEHREVHMRCDMEPFKDKRVRRAMALALNRPKIVQGLFQGRADIGNDSPFAPVFPSTDKSIPQRHEDLNEARQLLEAAGKKGGFKVTLTTQKYFEVPDYAVIIKDAVAPLGIDIDLHVESSAAYYGKAVFGQSDWLDSVLGITEYGHRGVPNVFLEAPLESGGSWNAAHFKNKEYDRLAAQYVAAVDLQTQRAVAGKIQRLLLDETPVIYSYFIDWLTPAVKDLQGVEVTAMGQLWLQRAYFTT